MCVRFQIIIHMKERCLFICFNSIQQNNSFYKNFVVVLNTSPRSRLNMWCEDFRSCTRLDIPDTPPREMQHTAKTKSASTIFDILSKNSLVTCINTIISTRNLKHLFLMLFV